MLVRKSPDLLCCLPHLNAAILALMQTCCGTFPVAAMPCTFMLMLDPEPALLPQACELIRRLISSNTYRSLVCHKLELSEIIVF